MGKKPYSTKWRSVLCSKRLTGVDTWPDRQATRHPSEHRQADPAKATDYAVSGMSLVESDILREFFPLQGSAG